MAVVVAALAYSGKDYECSGGGGGGDDDIVVVVVVVVVEIM